MSTNPTISAVIPAYNRATIVPRAIRSVLAQTYESWELIVVDDGSKDGTDRAVEAFRDSRIRLIRHSRNRGQSAARNTGIQAAKGRYVAFLDSDDEWLPEKLAREVELFEAAGERLGLAYCGKKLVGPDGKLLKVRMPTLQGNVHQHLLAWDFIGSCSRVTVRRRMLERAGGFDRELSPYDDWDLWLRIAEISEIGAVRECLVIRHFGSDQVSGSLRNIFESRLKVVNKYRQRMEPSTLARHLAVLSVILFNYEPKRARKMATESLKIRWDQPVVAGALAASLLGVRPYRRLFTTLARKRHGLFVGRAAI